MLDMDFLITGSPRSGTRTVSDALRHGGVDVRHEKFSPGHRGLVSGVFCVDDDDYPGRHAVRFADVRFRCIVHLVRHPLKTCPSLAVGMTDVAWNWTQKHTGIRSDMQPSLERAAQFWLRWTDIVDGLQPHLTIRFEDLREQWPLLQSAIDVDVPLPDPLPHTHQSNALPATWGDFGVATAEMLKKKVSQYGYEA